MKSEPKRVIMQSAVTDAKHPDLYEWWTTTEQERGEVIRLAVRRYIGERRQLSTISNQLERVERTLEKCVHLLEGEFDDEKMA